MWVLVCMGIIVIIHMLVIILFVRIVNKNFENLHERIKLLEEEVIDIRLRD